MMERLSICKQLHMSRRILLLQSLGSYSRISEDLNMEVVSSSESQ